MSKVVLYMSMSVDGFITGPDDGTDHGLGVDGERLHDWLRRRRRGPGLAPARRRGRRDRVRRDDGHRSGDHRPADVRVRGRLGRRPPRRRPDLRADPRRARPSPPPGHARYVTDGIESCVAQAKAAAGGRDILLHGAATAQACLRAGLLDEMELHLVPVLLGQGRRLFDDLPPDHVELELVRALDGPGVQHLRYRVRSEG